MTQKRCPASDLEPEYQTIADAGTRCARRQAWLRSGRQGAPHVKRYTRQRRREASLRETDYRLLLCRAEIALAFHVPDAVSQWNARWSGCGLRDVDLEELLWRWTERFPSPAAGSVNPAKQGMRRAQFKNDAA